jgi:hypothetical protein
MAIVYDGDLDAALDREAKERKISLISFSSLKNINSIIEEVRRLPPSALGQPM